MSVNLDQDVTNLTAQLAAKAGMEAIKIGGKIAKEILALILEKVKESQQNKSGLMSLKKLAKSGEELHVLKLNEEHLKEFQELAKDYNIGYAAITRDGQSRIFIKESQLELVKSVMQDILDRQKQAEQQQKLEEEMYKQLDEMDFKEVGEESEFARSSIDIEIDKIGSMHEHLKQQGIENDVIITDLKDNDIVTAEFKIKNEDRDKAEKIINDLKDKTLEEIKEIIQQFQQDKNQEQEENKAQEQQEENKEQDQEKQHEHQEENSEKNEDKKEEIQEVKEEVEEEPTKRTLEDVINKAKAKVASMTSNQEKTKTRTSHEER
ncbi:hypothetical protein [Gemella morbillorum]